jgi:hypothetical protein
MKEFFEKYKYHIGGSTIGLILLYLVYDMFTKKRESSTKEPTITFKEDKKEVVKAEISHEEFLIFMKTLKEQLQSLTQSMMQFNANHIKTHSKYKDFRDKLFTKDIEKKSILIDSISAYKDGQKTSNYIVNFGNSNSPEVYKNVIGFRLVNAIIPYTVYTVNDNNKNIKIDNTSFDLIPGSYTFVQLGNHLQTQINSSGLSGFTVTSDKTTFKYTISHASSFIIKWSEVDGYSYRLFGFEKEDTVSNNSQISTYSVDHSIHYTDLVIPEIPSIACKMSSKGKQIIARIPFNNTSGSLIYYRAPEGELQTSNYFYPMKLSSLTIQLFDDNGNEYDSNNGDNYFEFEITIVKNTELFK